MVKFFVRAIATGFALSLGAALFKKVQPHLGLAEKDKDKKAEDKTKDINAQDAATDPGLA
jgi:hypothetical protein